MKKIILFKVPTIFIIFAIWFNSGIFGQNYPIIDTGQDQCYDTVQVIPAPQPGNPFHGQDAQYDGIQPAYQENGDGTISDLNTGLLWQKYLLPDKYTYGQAHAMADTFSLAGYNDWRWPSIKELYSLIDFNGLTGMNATESVPFIDTTYFEFRYGNEATGERFIDAQYISATDYVGTTMSGDSTVFGVNFADGRIKGYGIIAPNGSEKLFEIRFVRGDTSYGINHFVDNSDGTVTDEASGLMWSRDDCGSGLNWQQALAWVQQKNQENYLGFNDWRLPNAKELQSIIDYSRSLQTTNSAAIDPLFNVTSINDEGGNTNYPFYWTNTTHADGPPDMRYTKAVYLAFGEALGFMEVPPNSGNYVLMDVHGAGAQRSDPKSGDPNNYPYGFGPQGDVIRIYNFVRLVRGTGLVGTNHGTNNKTLLSEFSLSQNYPNPFNPNTTIKFDLPKSSEVSLKVFNILGEEIATLVSDRLSAGSYSYEWDARNLGSGLYLYRLEAEGYVEMREMILMK